jgi:hypothetical protein
MTADALNANRACSAPWIKGIVERPVVPAAPAFKQHNWTESEDGGWECPNCTIEMVKGYPKTVGVSDVDTLTTLDVALYWWCLRNPKAAVTALAARCKG